MMDLKRIYWTRVGLRLAFAATMMWWAVSFAVALIPKGSAGANTSTVSEVFRGMVDGVVAAVMLPGLFVIVLTVVAGVINARDVRRRDPARRFTRQQRGKEWRGPAASARWTQVSAAVVPGLPSTATISILGPRAGQPACKTLSPPAPDATAPRAPGFRRRASRNGWKGDGWATSHRSRPSVSANVSRSPDVRRLMTRLPRTPLGSGGAA